MTSKPDADNDKEARRRGPSRNDGDGTDEQNLNERGDSAARITKAEVAAAFSGKAQAESRRQALKQELSMID